MHLKMSLQAWQVRIFQIDMKYYRRDSKEEESENYYLPKYVTLLESTWTPLKWKTLYAQYAPPWNRKQNAF